MQTLQILSFIRGAAAVLGAFIFAGVAAGMLPAGPMLLLAVLVVLAVLIYTAVQIRRTRRHDLDELIASLRNDLQRERVRADSTRRAIRRTRRAARLTQKVADRARTTAEEQARRLREMDEVRSRFFSDVCHEFRTPLTLIIGPLENLLADGLGEENVRGEIERALRNARRLLRLMNQLLDLSKLESGRMQLLPRRGRVVPIVEGALLSFTAFAESKNLQLNFRADDEEIEMHFDAACLEKILFNLLSNAVKFTPKGGAIDVAVEGSSSADGSSSVAIRVSDSGIGIRADELPYIFDRFHQVDESARRPREGTGIGLSLVKELVELHGGTVEARSEIGAGTDFVIVLPDRPPSSSDDLVDPDSAAENPSSSRGPLMEMSVFHEAEDDGASADASAEPDSRPVVLLVDDNRDLLTYVERSLHGEFNVMTALHGGEALERLRRHEPDVVVSDVMMPVMDGYQLCRTLKSDDRWKHVPVLLLTARASENYVAEGLELGADDYLAKPFSLRVLRARIQNLIAAGKQVRHLADKNRALKEEGALQTQLLNVAAHDMKNPLSVIRELAQLLKEEIDQESDAQGPLDLIHESSDQMLRLVGSVLESSAIEAGRLAIVPKCVDMGSLAAEVVRRNGPAAAKKNQNVKLIVGSDDVSACADPDLIYEALDNLVNNAVKYSPLGRTVTVRVERFDSTVSVSVQDDGPGLSAEDQDLLFRRFQTLSARPTGGESSTGLGLAIVKQIVDLHRGEVVVRSREGGGAIFAIELPHFNVDESAAADRATGNH